MTELECVYCAVRTVAFKARWLLYVPPGLKERLFPYTALTDWFL
jgi:hypothetical protein